MAKVLLLTASPRQDSNCEKVLEECKKSIEEQGLEAKIVSLKGKNVHSCIACQKCAELGECIFNDDNVNEIIAELKSEDTKGFIIASPVYFGMARGDMLSALQRIGYVSRRNNNFLSWKVGGPIAVGRRGGLTTTYSELLMFYFINEMIVPGSNYWNIVFGLAPGEALEDVEGIKTVKLFSQNVAKLIKKL